MKIIKYPALSLILLAASVIFGNAGTEFQFSRVEDILMFLENARIISVQPDENAGRTEPWMVVLGDGKTQHKAIFKHIDRTRPHPLPDSYQYELSAYKLHRMLGLNFIPPTVPRTLNGHPGALQLWVEDCVPLEEAIKDEGIKIDLPSIKDCLQDIFIFDALTFCGCRQTGDVLYQRSSGHLCRVDYSEAFVPKRELPSECEIQGCSQVFLEKLKSVEDEVIRRELKSYLNEEEIKTLLLRRHLILEKIGKIEDK
jgi:hypothetical protein